MRRGSPDGTGMEATFCCIQATLRDYGRFGMLFLNHGRSNGIQIVPAKWVDEATTPGSSQVQPGKLISGSPLGYQFQWWTFRELKIMHTQPKEYSFSSYM
jgi:CubicO group peptidase (beta-lactamase class C family)